MSGSSLVGGSGFIDFDQATAQYSDMFEAFLPVCIAELDQATGVTSGKQQSYQRNSGVYRPGCLRVLLLLHEMGWGDQVTAAVCRFLVSSLCIHGIV